MTLVPAGIAALVTQYCLVCAAQPGWRDPGSRAEVDLGHAVMGATTLVMVLGVRPAADTAMSASPADRAIDLLLIAALLVLTAAGLSGSSRGGQTLHCHLHTTCDVAMAATTGCLLAAML